MEGAPSLPKRARRNAPTVEHHRVSVGDDYANVQARSSTLRAGLPVHSRRSAVVDDVDWDDIDSWEPEDDPELALDPDSGAFDEDMDASITAVLDRADALSRSQGAVGSGEKKTRSQASARPNVFWKTHLREAYLDEILRADGRGDFRDDEACPDCKARRSPTPNRPEVRCQDCFSLELTCAVCCVRRHARQPLHNVERWTGRAFEPTSLKDLGLVVHLNHAGLRCPAHKPADSRLRILHTNGVHEIALSYCGCGKEVPRYQQLLRRGFYPATHQNTRTCATFPLLRLLHLLSLTAKVSTYDFYRAVEYVTPGSIAKRPRRRYRPLMRMLTQWRHLKLLKRGGRGHHPLGAGGTSDGELALLCPSCPHPGINLDEGWENAPLEKRFLYALLICMDANFRLKNNLVSNFSTDPGLGIGMAYMLRPGPYEQYVLSQADEKDISTCVGFQALAKATTRNTKGLRYTGVGAVVCGRSEMILPCGVGNLHKGERYANMDYILASSIRATKLLIVAISYDVVCQWFINLFTRILGWPADVRLRPGLHVRPYIPKFHAPAHKEEDHEQYSLNFGDGAGLTDGEAPERVWAPHNALANSTKTAGPGTRQDILDDNFAFWNFHKYRNMGQELIRKYKSAIGERNRQTEAHRGFTKSLPSELVDEWEALCSAWAADIFPKTAENPYDAGGAEITEDAARKELAELDAAAREEGAAALHETPPASFIWTGLEIEETQRRLKIFATAEEAKPKNLRDPALKDRRTHLRNRIQGWEQLRAVYVPGLLQILQEQGTSPSLQWELDPKPENVELWLPSSIPANRRRAACVEGVPEIELKLRLAQCESSLQALRQVLRLKTRMVYFKNKNISGQRDGTRSRSVIDGVHRRAIRHVQKYRCARSAVLKLRGTGEWQLTYRELKNEDVRSYSVGKKKTEPDRRGIWEDGHEPPPQSEAPLLESDQSESESDMEMDVEEGARLTQKQILKKLKKGTGETRKELSWIWQTAPLAAAASEGEQVNKVLRAEWSRSRARSMRAQEEVELLLEEMRRVLAFLERVCGIWEERKFHRPGATGSLREGLDAYAERQISLQKQLDISFRALWRTPLRELDSTLTEVALTEEDVNEGMSDDDSDDSDDGEEDFPS